MTPTITGPHDPERTLAKPVEEVTQAIYDKPTSFDGDTIATHLCGSWLLGGAARDNDELYAMVRRMCEDAAEAAIATLKSHGWLTEGYFTAAKAERDGK